jgi:hypothetical protein
MRIRRGTPRANWMHYQNHQLITPVRLAVSPVSWLDEGSGKDWCEERAFSVGGGGAEDPCVHLGAVSETVMLHACLALINILLLRSVPPFLPASSSLLSCLLPILLFFSLSFSHSSILSPFNFSSLGPLPQPPLSAYNLTIDTLTRKRTLEASVPLRQGRNSDSAASCAQRRRVEWRRRMDSTCAGLQIQAHARAR